MDITNIDLTTTVALVTNAVLLMKKSLGPNHINLNIKLIRKKVSKTNSTTKYLRAKSIGHESISN